MFPPADLISVMMRQDHDVFDEYQSKENARQGFWNRSLPSTGNRAIEKERRGVRVKKRLEIHPLHADTPGAYLGWRFRSGR